MLSTQCATALSLGYWLWLETVVSSVRFFSALHSTAAVRTKPEGGCGGVGGGEEVVVRTKQEVVVVGQAGNCSEGQQSGKELTGSCKSEPNRKPRKQLQ